MTQPTEAHWQEAERQYRAFTDVKRLNLYRDEVGLVMAELVAQGAVAGTPYSSIQHIEATDTELRAARDLVNAKIGSPRYQLDATTRGDVRFHCIASMMRSLGQATADPLSDGERKELAELRAFKADVKKLGGW